MFTFIYPIWEKLFFVCFVVLFVIWIAHFQWGCCHCQLYTFFFSLRQDTRHLFILDKWFGCKYDFLSFLCVVYSKAGNSKLSVQHKKKQFFFDIYLFGYLRLVACLECMYMGMPELFIAIMVYIMVHECEYIVKYSFYVINRRIMWGHF